MVYLLLTGLPGAAAALFAAARGVKQVPILLAIGLAASGLVATVGFWAFYAEPEIGQTFSFFVALGSALLVASTLRERRVEGEVLRALAVPLGLWAFGTLFILFLGFVHGGTGEPLTTGSIRFGGQLPSDSSIPQFFADWFYLHGHSGTPPEFPGEWLASDRPPLQIGYVLVERPFGWDSTGLRYQVIGVVLQQLWIVGLWGFLLAARIGRTTRALTMGVVLVSALAIVNGFYVWPKLLPAGMLLAAAALVLTPLWEELRGSLWAAVLFAALCGLAMLAHGASIFGVVPLLVVAALRGMPSWRWLGIAALVGIVLLAPWSAYQKYGDPPGNRLVKWQLGGVVEVDDRGALEAITDTYREIGLDGAIDYKLQNFKTMVAAGETEDALRSGFESGSLTTLMQSVRAVNFLYLLPSLGLLLLGPIAMLATWRDRRRREPEWRFALLCFAAFAIGAFVWGLLIIGGDAQGTSIHVGSYLVPILGISGCVAGLRASLPRFAVPYVLAIATLSLALYAPFLGAPPGTSYSVLSALIAAAALAGFGALAVLAGRNAEAGGARGPRRSAGPRG